MGASTPASKLLIVDDDSAQIKILCGYFDTVDYTVACFTSAADALAMLRERTFDLVLTDLHMPEMDGIAFLRAAREIDPDLVGIIMAGHDALDDDGQMMEAGALDYIVKPFNCA